MLSKTNYINMNTQSTAEESALNNIKGSGTSKEQLKKVATEFESIFVTQMLEAMDKSVDREGGLFNQNEMQYYDKFKSYMFNQMGRDIASNEHTSFGLAKQIYTQMERYCKG